MSAPVDVLADAEREIAAANQRIENLRRELQRPNCADREGKRATIRRIAAHRDEISRPALARVKGVQP